MRKLKEGKRGWKTVSRALACSLLLIHSLCGVRRDGRLREKGDFSAPLKYGITLEIIARHRRSMLGGGNLISRWDTICASGAGGGGET